MARLNLSAPWVLYYHEVKAMFEKDYEVTVIYDDSEENKPELKIYVDTEYAKKAEAIEKLLPASVRFGTVGMGISVIPINTGLRFSKSGKYYGGKRLFNKDLDSPIDIFYAAFNNNCALINVDVITGVFSNPIYYVTFRKEVVQYFTDDLSDPNGIRSTLYQEIAKEIFKPIEGVYYCTDTRGYDTEC